MCHLNRKEQVEDGKEDGKVGGSLGCRNQDCGAEDLREASEANRIIITDSRKVN